MNKMMLVKKVQKPSGVNKSVSLAVVSFYVNVMQTKKTSDHKLLSTKVGQLQLHESEPQ